MGYFNTKDEYYFFYGRSRADGVRLGLVDRVKGYSYNFFLIK